MAELASIFGFTGVTAENIKKDTVMKDRIKLELMKYLESSTFADGGIASIAHSVGEDGIAFVRNGEGFVKPEHVSDIRLLLDNIKPLSSLVNLAKPNIPNMVTNNSSSPTVVFNLNGGTINSDTMGQFNKWKSDITNEVTKAIINASRPYR
jgi:hypothetical protein